MIGAGIPALARGAWGHTLPGGDVTTGGNTMRLTQGIARALTLVALAAAGCESDSSDNDRDDRDIYRRDRLENERARDRARDDDRVISRDRDPVRRDDSDRRRGINEIPADAVAVEGGEGTAGLSHTAQRDGTIYVYDVDDDRVVFVGRMMSGERFRLLPDDNEATLDGRPVFRSDLNPRHRYRLYFDRRR
jgi:hypothetical protein